MAATRVFASMPCQGLRRSKRSEQGRPTAFCIESLGSSHEAMERTTRWRWILSSQAQILFALIHGNIWNSRNIGLKSFLLYVHTHRSHRGTMSVPKRGILYWVHDPFCMERLYREDNVHGLGSVVFLSRGFLSWACYYWVQKTCTFTIASQRDHDFWARTLSHG
ncbi:hypothetical protein BGZ63DRAFT_392838 [Mariannaea sp. PMI_226]|nr:hypothetical protein BGZ63DRAFT_392838 [Mariannaea sp. PMI_226]